MQRPELSQFRRDGWLGPVRLLGAGECRLLNHYLADAGRAAGANWGKELASTDRIVYDLAADDRVLDLVRPLIGDDVVIWSASVIERAPGEAHPWHTDIETADSGGRAVSLWIALDNASAESALNFISGSHRFGVPLQRAALEQGVGRERRTAGTSLALARTVSDEVDLAQPAIEEGDALLFDGRTWHGSLNTRTAGTRRALLLQYAAADLAIRIPDWGDLDWPFRFKRRPLPPVVAVSGRPAKRLNRVVGPPPVRPDSSRTLHKLAVSIPSPLPPGPDGGWRRHPFYQGSTPVLRKLSCHASVLDPGYMPHPPHAHLDEEILIVLDGEADILIAGSGDDPAPRVERMRAGDLVYYPSFQYHTIRGAGDRPVSYFMYRWNGSIRPAESALETTILRGLTERPFPLQKPFQTLLLAEQSTGLLDRLHLHLSLAQPGGGYAAHRDRHDVAILLFEGAVKTMGRVIRAPAAILYPAMSLHGLSGAGDAPARYLVVEFHGPHESPPTWLEVIRWRRNLLLDDLRARVRWRVKRLKNRLGRT